MEQQVQQLIKEDVLKIHDFFSDANINFVNNRVALFLRKYCKRGDIRDINDDETYIKVSFNAIVASNLFMFNDYVFNVISKIIDLDELDDPSDREYILRFDDLMYTKNCDMLEDESQLQTDYFLKSIDFNDAKYQNTKISNCYMNCILRIIASNPKFTSKFQQLVQSHMLNYFTEEQCELLGVQDTVSDIVQRDSEEYLFYAKEEVFQLSSVLPTHLQFTSLDKSRQISATENEIEEIQFNNFNKNLVENAYVEQYFNHHLKVKHIFKFNKKIPFQHLIDSTDQFNMIYLTYEIDNEIYTFGSMIMTKK